MRITLKCALSRSLVLLMLFMPSVIFSDSIINLTQTKTATKTQERTKGIPMLDGTNIHDETTYISLQKPTQTPFNQKITTYKKNLLNKLKKISKYKNQHTSQENMQNHIENPKIQTTQNPSMTKDSKPKVLLIMDDLSNPSQLKQLLSLKLNITPSLFPPTKYYPKTPQMAQNLTQNRRDFMLHLPLEALNFEQKELMPIKVGTSKETIRTILREIKRDFPNLTYINNHTGSKFTQSRADMENLLQVFDELDFKFIDSITTANSASEAISMEQNRLIMQRDVFLDNIISIDATKTQLRHLIATAQKNGYAIAICHPHPSTFEALKAMQGEILAQVELISPNALENHLIKQDITHYKRHRFYAKQ